MSSVNSNNLLLLNQFLNHSDGKNAEPEQSPSFCTLFQAYSVQKEKKRPIVRSRSCSVQENEEMKPEPQVVNFSNVSSIPTMEGLEVISSAKPITMVKGTGTTMTKVKNSSLPKDKTIVKKTPKDCTEVTQKEKFT